jgi:thiamine kinase-like enzyme
VGPAGQGVPALEVRVAQQLARIEAPVAVLDPRIAPRVHEADGFAVTFWTHYEAVAPDHDSPADYAEALHRLHAGMRHLEIDAPRFMERTAAAEWLLSNPDRSPALAEDDRRLLLDTLDSARLAIGERGAPEQLLHGEPHQGNLLRAQGGPLFIDFETCCRGPVEFDVAHLPAEASAHYPEVDERLLSECRRLVLAMVAAWRWDVDDEFPDGHRHGQNILDILREGPPWRPLGDLSGD